MASGRWVSLLKVSTAYFSLIKNAKSKKFSTVCYNNAIRKETLGSQTGKSDSQTSQLIISCLTSIQLHRMLVVYRSSCCLPVRDRRNRRVTWVCRRWWRARQGCRHPYPSPSYSPSTRTKKRKKKRRKGRFWGDRILSGSWRDSWWLHRPVHNQQQTIQRITRKTSEWKGLSVTGGSRYTV